MKQFQFKTFENDKKLEDFLDTKSNKSEFIRNILDDFRTGKLSYANTEDSVKAQIELEKLKQIKERNKRIDETESLKLRKLEAETELLERQIAYHDNFGKTPSIYR